MLNESDLNADLPAPRDDEPAGLRSDIRDELSDHLHCALRREILAGTTNQQEAWQRVLARFGNPATVALRCWLINMKGKLFMQRLTFGITLLLAVGVLGLAGLIWRMMDSNQRTTAALIDELKQLRMQPTQLSPESVNWIPFKVKLVSGTKDGPPVVDQTVMASGHFTGVSEEAINKNSDTRGIVDFGRVHPDSYEMTINMPWGEYSSVPFRVMPGYEPEVIVCPENTAFRKMTVKLDVPKDLENEALSYYLTDSTTEENSNHELLQRQRQVNGLSWNSGRYTKQMLHDYEFNSSGKHVAAVGFGGVILERPEDAFGNIAGPLGPNVVKEIFIPNSKPVQFDQIYVKYQNDSEEPPQWGSGKSVEKAVTSHKENISLLPNFSSDDQPLVFDPQKDTSERWTINLNDAFWEGVRTELKKAKEADIKNSPRKTPKVRQGNFF